MDIEGHYPQNTISHCIISNETWITLHFFQGRITAMPEIGADLPGVTLPPCRDLWGRLHIGDDIDCNTCPHPGVPRVESHLFTVGGFLGNSKGMAWKTESMQNMGV